MSRFVLDASVVLSWCFPDEKSLLGHKISLMFAHGDSAIAPSFWPLEVLNALLAGEKRKRISPALVQEFLSDLQTLPVELESVSAQAIFEKVQELSRGFNLTAYDAAYLQLAQANRLPIATLDQDLIAACKQSGVGLVSV